MQNEETPTEVNPYLEIVDRMSKPALTPLDMPVEPAPERIPSFASLSNPYIAMQESLAVPAQPRLPSSDKLFNETAIGSLSSVMGINPDQAAEATKLGTPLGIGQDLALYNMDEVRQRSVIAMVQRTGMLQNNPRLAQSLLDPVFAAQAHDDLDSLAKTSSLFDKAVNFIGPELFDRRPGQALRIAKVLEDGYAIGELGAELGALKSRRKGYIAFGGTPENETVLNDRIAFLEKQLANKEPSGFFGSAAMVTAQALAMARPVGTVALMGAGVGGAVGGPPGAAVGFVAGLQAGIVGTSAQVEGGFLFDDMVAQGVEPETAYYASVAGGTVIGMIELVGDRLFAGSFKPITRFLRQELTQQLAKPTIRSAAAEFGKQTLKQMAVGGAEEGSQRLVADAFSELGKAIDGVPTDFTWSQMAKNIASDFAAGVQGSALIGAVGPGLSLMVDVRRAEAVSAQEEFFDGLDAAKKDGKLPKRNLDAYEGFLARQAKGTTADTVYVEAEAAAQVLAQSGLSVTELEKVLPGIREQLQNALENGGDITIPTAVYGAKLSGTQLGDALRPHMRLSPEAMSVAQAQEFSRKRDALRQEAQAALAERQEADAAFVESAQKVDTTVADQLRQTGMQDIEVRANAELFRDLAVTQAARMGITPEQFYERYPYRVRGPQVVQEGQPLEQARREPAPEKGVFNANNPPADVTAAGGRQAIMAVMDYEGKIYYDRSATMHGDLLDSFPELDADLIIDGGFIRDGKYIPNMSDGGFAAIEGGRERLALVKAFANKANQRAGAVDAVAQIDIDYLDAVERGDMATAQRMVDDASYAQGYQIEAFHGTDAKDFAAFRYGDTYNWGPALYFSPSREYATEYQDRTGEGEPRVMRVKLRIDNMFSPESNPEHLALYRRLTQEARDEGLTHQEFDISGPQGTKVKYGNTGLSNLVTYTDQWWLVEKLWREGFDGFRTTEADGETVGIAVRDPSQVKLADPVTRDEAGNVVPLSRRFDITSPKVFEQAAVQPEAERVLGPIEAAKKIVRDTEREVFTDADEFFKKRWDSLLKKTKRQVKPTSRNFREAAKRAVSDILDFVKNNPKFADYYANDWKVTRSILDDYVGRAITDDEFLMFRAIAGLTSPNTMLPSNISDTVGLWDYWMRERNFDAFTLGPKPGTGALVVFEAAEPISGTTANVKVRTIRIIERLIKERGGVKQALNYLQEGVPVKELHKFNRKMGYSGAVGDIGNITDLVQQATGQSELIPRMFIFGQKVGAYTLNAIGDERYTTVDIWESRYIRSHFIGMFDINIGLPESTDEHQIFTRFGELFKEEMEAVTGRKWAPSALQALRWFYIIGSAREAGYSKASTNETISFYTERRLIQAFGYPGRAATGGGPGLGAFAPGGAAGQVRAARIPPKRFERDLESDVAKLPDPSDRRRAIAAGYVRYARYNSELGQREFSFDERRGGPARQHGILNATVAADFVPGERLKSAFGKANLPIQAMQELVADANGAQAFRSLVADTNSSNPYGAAVAVYTVEEYQGKRLFVTEDATAGFALTADGDIVSVFSAAKSGNGRALMTLAVQAGGRRLDCFDTALPSYYAAHGFKAVARLPWNDEYAPAGWDTKTFEAFNAGRPDVVFMVYQRGYNGEYESGDGATVQEYDAGVQAQTRALQSIAKSQMFEQAMPGRAPRGDFDPAKLMTTLREGRDFSTFAHETAHFYLTILADIARSATGPQQTKADMDALLSWFGIEGATPAERLAKWSSLTIDQQRQYHEQFAYSFEIYLHEGKAPSVEMQSLFNQFAAWLKRVYKSIRDELNATYKAQFGRDLPMMNSEIRLVMDRMLATDEQIARAQAVRGMKAMFQTQEQSGMNDAEWAAYQALEQDATDAATAELTKATLKELQWYGNAQSKYLREIQSKHDRARKEIREEVSAQVQLEPVYRAMEFLKRGTIRTDTGEVTAATGAYKLDLAKVRAIMPAGFDPASLKYGKYGMVQDGGIDPDMAAGMFGYGSGVELINAILGAKPIKEEIDARTDQRMLDENSDLATPEARQAAVDMAIHNEARARFIAVEQRWLEKQRRPANDMLQAARQVAQDIIGDVVIRTLNPRRYEAAEAEAARTATTAYREPQDPSTAGQAAATRAYNEAIAAGQTPDEATVDATEAGVAAVAKAQERRADFNAKYGGREPAEVARRAKRQQLVQNQLAREAMLAKEEIAVAGRDFRKFFRSDEKLAKTRDMAPIMAARAILSYYGYGKRGESPAQYLDQLRTYAPELYDQIAPIVLKSLSGTADYRDLTVTEFRVLRDTVQALWAQARRDRQITVEGERVALDVVLKEMADRLQAIGVGERVGQRQAPGAVDQANRHLLGLRAMMSRVEAWADALDGMAGPGAFTKYLFRPVKQAVDAYRIERNKYVERFVKLLDGIDLPVGKIAAPELDYTFGNGNGGIGRAELLGALMHTGNEGNYRKLLLGRGWGKLDADGNLDDSRWRSFVARMISEGKLTKADYDFVQSIWDLLEEIKPLAQRAHFDMYGYYFKEVEATEVVTPFGTYRGGYVPAATDKFMVQDARVNASMDELEGDWRNSLPSTGAGFTKGRVDYNEALSLDLRLIATHTDAVLRFSMIQPSVKDALKILRDRDLKALLERFDPAVMENMLLPWLNRAARQQAMEPGRWKLADKFWGGVRSRAGVATMFANLRNALQQFTGWFPSLLKVKRRYLQSALMTYLGSPKQTAEAVARLSPFMADRMRNQMFELQGTMNELLLNPSKYEKLQQWSSKHGYFLQQAFQNMVDVTTWQGAYNQALAEGETQAEAVARADAAVRLTQGSLSPEDLSMFEVGTPFYRTFVQFTGYFNMLANLNLGEFQKTVRDMGWRSGKGRLLYIYVMGMLLPAIVSDAIVRSLGGGWDDEDEDGYMDVFMDWFFGSQVRMGAALLPFGSTAYTAITTAFNDKPYDDRITTSPSIAALESATIGTSKAIIAVTDEDKDVTGRNVRDVLTLITLLTGVPVSALGRPAGYLVDVERGEIEPESGYDMIRGMITGTATPESKR